jgi:hypothetical protein
MRFRSIVENFNDLSVTAPVVPRSGLAQAALIGIPDSSMSNDLQGGFATSGRT